MIRGGLTDSTYTIGFTTNLKSIIIIERYGRYEQYFLRYEFRSSAPFTFEMLSVSDKSKVVICEKGKMTNGESILALFW